VLFVLLIDFAHLHLLWDKMLCNNSKARYRQETNLQTEYVGYNSDNQSV